MGSSKEKQDNRTSGFNYGIGEFAFTFISAWAGASFSGGASSLLKAGMITAALFIYGLIGAAKAQVRNKALAMTTAGVVAGLFLAPIEALDPSLRQPHLLFLVGFLASITTSLGTKRGLVFYVGYLVLVLFGWYFEYRDTAGHGFSSEGLIYIGNSALMLTGSYAVSIVSRVFYIEKMNDAVSQGEEARKDLRDALAEKNRLLELAAIENRRVFVKHEQFSNLGTMVSGLSHELGTPLGNAILTSSNMESWIEELLVIRERDSRRATVLGDRLIKGAQLIGRNLDRANNLINTFKHVSLNQLRNARETVNLRECVEKSTMLLMPTLNQMDTELRISIGSNITLKTYQFAIEQIITNLVTNAVRHGLENKVSGCITVSAIVDKQNENVCIEVHDNGRGIPQAALGRIFEPFFTTKRGSGGTGMGLSIVQHLATSVLDGHIDVKTSPNTGTSFFVTIPMESPEVDVVDDATDSNPMKLN